MIEFALILYCVFLAVAIGWRGWRQYRLTGDHGIRGFSGSMTSLERLAGLLFIATLIAFLAAPVATLLGLLRCAEFPRWISVLGIVLAMAGFVLVLVAQGQMGSSWRIGVDPSERTELIKAGMFAMVRNPIFSGMGVFTVGLSILVPNLLSILGLLLGAIGLELQVRWVEEPYLLRTHGDAYAEYTHRVGRFVPAVGRLLEKRTS